MLVLRKYFGVISFGGKFYVFGGFNSYRRFKSVECFDLYEQQWIFVVFMLCLRMYLVVGILGGLLYVVGGYDGLLRLSSVECYDF